jgi:preprotein translocase subunit SecE
MADAAQPKKKTNPMVFLRQVRQEGRKVTWSSRKEVIASTIMVVIMVILAALFFFVVDQILGLTVRFLMQSG